MSAARAMNTGASRPFGAIILAAGLGSRLGRNTSAMPKCLVPVAGVPMLQRMLDNLAGEGVSSVTIVVGYLAGAIRRFVRDHYPGLRIEFVENVDYAVTGSVYSLHLALREFPADEDLLLIEGDVVLAPPLLNKLLQAGRRTSALATLLAAYEPSLSGTFALVDQGRVGAWLHESVRTPDFPLARSFKTVNLTYAQQPEAVAALTESVRRVIVENGRRAPLEYAMQSLVGSGWEIDAVTTGDSPWFEVDTPADLAIADRMFAARTEAA